MARKSSTATSLNATCLMLKIYLATSGLLSGQAMALKQGGSILLALAARQTATYPFRARTKTWGSLETSSSTNICLRTAARHEPSRPCLLAPGVLHAAYLAIAGRAVDAILCVLLGVVALLIASDKEASA